MSLDKDPQQEGFLQGRMLGNPYSSTGLELGPLTREIKNKICANCELVALLEDDGEWSIWMAGGNTNGKRKYKQRCQQQAAPSGYGQGEFQVGDGLR